jgi:hypothetical protein
MGILTMKSYKIYQKFLREDPNPIGPIYRSILFLNKYRMLCSLGIP